MKDVGMLEMLFALTPMLSGFSLGGFPMSVLIWIILIMVVLIKKKGGRLEKFKPLTLFIVYWLVHNLFVSVTDNVNLNGIIQQVLMFLAFYLMCPILRINKLRGSLNWVALVSIVGLLYQWTILVAGGLVHPLGIPGLSMSEARMEILLSRPSSFFMEPAAYVAFMLCPLALSLIDRKYVWSSVMVLSIFLTTSTTGLVLSFVLLGVSLFGVEKGKKLSNISLLILVAAGLFYALIHFEAFETGVEKIENTDAETNIRLSQGPYVVSTMQPAEYLFGAPYATAYTYCKSGRAPNVVMYGESVYTSTFWTCLLLYGIVGLILYLNIYYNILKRSKITMPLVVSLVLVMFSSEYWIGVHFIYTLTFLLVLVKSDRLISFQKQNK